MLCQLIFIFRPGVAKLRIFPTAKAKFRRNIWKSGKRFGWRFIHSGELLWFFMGIYVGIRYTAIKWIKTQFCSMSFFLSFRLFHKLCLKKSVILISQRYIERHIGMAIHVFKQHNRTVSSIPNSEKINEFLNRPCAISMKRCIIGYLLFSLFVRVNFKTNKL